MVGGPFQELDDIAVPDRCGWLNALTIDLYMASAARVSGFATLLDEADVLEPRIDSVPLFHTAIIAQS